MYVSVTISKWFERDNLARSRIKDNLIKITMVIGFYKIYQGLKKLRRSLYGDILISRVVG